MSSIRSASYSMEEDIFLCHVYLDVSQNPIIGINQSGDQFWKRVLVEYEKSEFFPNQPRPQRSLQTRMTTILSAVSKLRGCVNQIENKNPSGASEQDIVSIYIFGSFLFSLSYFCLVYFLTCLHFFFLLFSLFANMFTFFFLVIS